MLAANEDIRHASLAREILQRSLDIGAIIYSRRQLSSLARQQLAARTDLVQLHNVEIGFQARQQLLRRLAVGAVRLAEHRCADTHTHALLAGGNRGTVGKGDKPTACSSMMPCALAVASVMAGRAKRWRRKEMLGVGGRFAREAAGGWMVVVMDELLELLIFESEGRAGYLYLELGRARRNGVMHAVSLSLRNPYYVIQFNSSLD
ncbi:MAG: hypothetical protein M1829_003479 [Trizodia sp. TS-e1964]|nr:MAG: hypothetical protein M1829_003479 [Trizodia sp. TS-e1964]